MQRRSVEAIVQALNTAGVRYLIVGGLAVVAHGHVRFTADVDLVLDMDDANLRRAVAELSGLGDRPRAPVHIEEYLDPDRRQAWASEKGMTVFSLYSHAHPATELDLFVQPPFEFAHAYARAARMEIAPGVAATFAGLDDLLALKRATGRIQDMFDVERLEALRKEHDDDGSR